MDKDRQRRWLRPPSPAMIVALVALVFAMSGTAVAASQLMNGDEVIKKGTLSGNRLRDNTVTGRKIKAGTLGTAQFGAVPAARVTISHATVTAQVPSHAFLKLSYDVENYDAGNMYDPANPSRLTAPVAGKYLVMANCRWNANVTGRRVVAVRKNGTADISQSQVSAYYSGGVYLNPEHVVAVVCPLAAGDYVEVRAYQDSGAVLSLTGDDSNWFSMVWVAP